MTEQEPYDDAGAPFPTTYYLTCPHLVAAVSRLEAAGGVERWSATVASSPALQSDLAAATVTQRQVRRRLAAGRTGADDGGSLDSGIGGSRNPGQLKCLHAHVAFALAQPGYRLGESVLAELGALPAKQVLLTARPGAVVSPGVDGPRRDWEDGSRRYELACRDTTREPRLQHQFDIILGELRRRVGGHFTLATLAAVYAGSESWMLQAVEEAAPAAGWARTVSMVGDAAFHTYARGAVDYQP